MDKKESVITLELTTAQLAEVALAAHKLDVTLNEFVLLSLKHLLEKEMDLVPKGEKRSNVR